MKGIRISSFVYSVFLLPMLSGTAFAQAATDLNCAQCVGPADIAVDAVNSAKIDDGSIKTIDLSANSVTTANIAKSAVTAAKLSPGIREQLDGAIAQIQFEFVLTQAVTASSAACPVDKFAVSASCSCSSNGGANNYGVLVGCATAGDGVVGSCVANALTYNPALPAPIALAKATCMGVTTSGSTALTALPTGLAQIDGKNENEALWRKELQETREAALAEQQKEAAAFMKAMQQ